MRNISADIAKVLAIFMVVIIHVESQVWYRYGDIEMSWWWASNLYDALARWCVPVFLMISGMFLLSKEEPLKMFFRKRITKVVYPFMFVGIIYILFYNLFLNKELSVLESIRMFIEGKVSFHFWFIYLIISLYLITPFLRVIFGRSDKKMGIYFIGLWFTYTTIEWTLSKFYSVNIGLRDVHFTGYIGYFVLGYILSKVQIRKAFLYPIFIVSVVATAYGSFYTKVNGMGDYFGMYLSPNIIVMSSAIFLILIQTDFKKIKVLAKLSPIVYEVYLIHILIRTILYSEQFGFGFQPIQYNPLWSIPLISLIIFCASVPVAFLINKLMKLIP